MRKLQFSDIENLMSKIDNINIFHYLTDDEKWELLMISNILEYIPEEKIISQGETGACFYAILSGAVNVTAVNASSGKEVFLSIIGEGEFFGEAGIFRDTKRTANVSAATTTELIRIDRGDFFKFICMSTSAGVKILMLFIDGLLKKLSDSNKELAFERRQVLDQSAVDQFFTNYKKQ